MTKREAYVLGWAYGRLASALGDKYDRSGIKFGQAMERPLSGFAAIHSAAMGNRDVDDDLSQQIANALDEIDIDNLSDESTEPVIPLDLQGSWDLGYHKGLNNSMLPIYGFSIDTARKKAGMSQVELAEKTGFNQAQISRWERGINRPSAEQIEKIKRALE